MTLVSGELRRRLREGSEGVVPSLPASASVGVWEVFCAVESDAGEVVGMERMNGPAVVIGGESGGWLSASS